MAWTPKIEAQFIRPLAKNMLAIMKRDSPEALLWAAAPNLVDPFAWYGLAFHVEPRFPFLLVLADSTDQEVDADGTRIEEVHTLSVQVGALAADPDRLADEIFIRVNAVDSIIKEASWEDLLAGIATSSYGPVIIEAGRHDYGQLPRRNANQHYMQVAAIAVKISYFETKLGVI